MDEKKASRVELAERTVGGGYLHLWRVVRGVEKISPNVFRGMIKLHGAGVYVYTKVWSNPTESTVWKLYNPNLIGD